MTKQPTIQLRLVIPRGIEVQGQELYSLALGFFAARREQVFVQEKLLKLSQSLPAILEGTVSTTAFEAFLLNFPRLDKIIVLTDKAAQAAMAAA